MAVKEKVTGFNIYKDKKNRDIYYDIISKQGFVITPAVVSKFNFYQKRFIIPVVIFALTYSIDLFGIKFGVIGASAIAILSLLVSEFFFRFRFLKTLVTLPKFVPDKKENYFHQLASGSPASSLLLKGILYILLGCLLIVFGIQESFQLIEWIACIIITIILVMVGIFQLYAAFIKKNLK